MAYSAEAIRNVALVGHRGAGKTSLHEALLFEAGVLTRLGSVTEGTTASDIEADEQARQMSISMTLSSFDWGGRKMNLLDTPGEPSFVADALGALRVCESAVFVVNAVMGAEVTTRRLWKIAAERDIARMLFVNMLDRERADFYRTLESLKAAFGPHVVATEIPIGSEQAISGVIDLVDMRAYSYEGAARGNAAEIENPESDRARAQEYRENRLDEVAEVSDELMERYLEGAEISHEEIVEALAGHQPRFDLPRRLRCGHTQSRHQPPARVDRRGPALAGRARCVRDGGGHARAGRRPRAVRLRLQDPRRPVRRAHQPPAGLPGHAHHDSQLANTRAHPRSASAS